MKKGNDALYFFHQGTTTYAYDYLGCHMKKSGSGYRYTFRTWAPGALSVSVVGDDFGWEEGRPLTRLNEAGTWELSFRTEKDLRGHLYKYRILSPRGTGLKGDPYAFASEGGAGGASLICAPGDFSWEDAGWMAHRKQSVGVKDGHFLPTPVNIYEVHAGSFRRHADGSYFSYRELADTLAPYLVQMGYTHVELLPIAEYPYDGSWGYQVGAFYAPTSRYGAPEDFRYFVDKLHRAGIGVLMDWVPAHFPKDAWGLYEFDGGPLYEYQGHDRMESASWGTRFFDLGRPEVQSFLVSNALYWLREFHLDGLRVDAVAAMIYLDYDRKPGEWFPNAKGNNHNLEAVAFLQKLNAAVLGEFPDVLMIAEESTDWGGVTRPVEKEQLGFSLKWNMGFANDFFDYLGTDPVFRRYRHGALNFPLLYAFRENYVLPVSHDEVVHGKKSFLDKIFGSYEDKFRQMRTALLLMMTYPGKKLLFMGTEYAPFREWDYASELEWFMLDYPPHKAMQAYVAALNRFYLAHPQLWEIDFDEEGFSWLLPDEAEKNLVAYCRHAMAGEALVCAVSFSGAENRDVQLCVPAGAYETVFDSVGDGSIPHTFTATERGLFLTLPPFSGVILQRTKSIKSKETTKENKG